jgi:ATP-dependent helicase IRC3
MSTPTLRPYQARALGEIAAARERGTNRVLVKKPTGTGKTVMFAAMPTDPRLGAWLASLPARGARMLVIAHREELLDQAAAKIQAANPGKIVTIEQGERYAHRRSDVVIASIQTLAARKFHRLKALLTQHSFPLVVVDEAHHAAAASYRTALVHLGFLPPADASEKQELEAPEFDDVVKMEAALRGWDQVAPKDRLLVGVTATPNRSDAIGLGCVFQTIAYSYDLKAAIEDGWLVPIKPWVIETGTSLDDVRIARGEFNQRDLADTVNTDARNKLAVAGWHEYAKGLPTIAFTVDVAHAHALAAEFRQAGVRAAAVSGETPKEERRQILADYTAGRLDVVTNCMVLTEGTDLPLTRCILHAKPTKSATLYEQMTGRGLRIHPGKPDCIVIDLVDVARRHSLQAAPVLYGLPPSLVAKGKSLKKLADELEELRQRHPGVDLDAELARGPMTLEQLQARASTFDVWKIPELGVLREVVTMNWLKQGDDSFRLQYPWDDGTEVLRVGRNLLGQFEVSAELRTPGSGSGIWHAKQSTIATGVDTAEAALRMAEHYVQTHRRAAARLKDREAPWRAKPASEKQIALLQRKRIPFRKGITSGEASDLIDMAMAKGGRR